MKEDYFHEGNKRVHIYRAMDFTAVFTHTYINLLSRS